MAAPRNVIASLVPGVRPVRDVLEEARSRSVRSAALLVGPEGDFTDQETAMALEAGFSPVTLGPIVLRVETAAFFGLAAMRYALDCVFPDTHSHVQESHFRLVRHPGG